MHPDPAKPVTTMEQLHEKLGDLANQAKVIENTADADKRSMTAEEIEQVSHITAAFKEIEREIEARTSRAEMEAKITAPQRRVTQPSDVEVDNAPRPPSERDHEERRPHITGGYQVGAAKGSFGFRSLGEWATAARRTFLGRPDQRIVNAPASFGSEGTNADGGYAVPPDFRDRIMKAVAGEQSLLARTDQQVTSSNRLTVPVDNSTPWQTSGGVTAEWTAEAADKALSKPALGQLNVQVNKLAALVPLTDELLEDVPALTNWLYSKIPEKFTSKINNAIVDGDGTGKPLGLLQSGAKITVAAVSGQGAGTIVAKNIMAMWARLYAPYRDTAIWIVNQDAEGQLQQLVMPGTNPSFPAYMPPGGFSDSPFAKLFGRPIVAVEAAKALGTEGDIILTDPKQYLSVLKAGGMKSDVSIHLYFQADVTAFRFVLRIGGQPYLSAPISRQNGSNTLSSIVTLNGTRT